MMKIFPWHQALLELTTDAKMIMIHFAKMIVHLLAIASMKRVVHSTPKWMVYLNGPTHTMDALVVRSSVLTAFRTRLVPILILAEETVMTFSRLIVTSMAMNNAPTRVGWNRVTQCLN
jgi:hypothetical protein